MEIKIFGIELIYYFLAYAGMMIHILSKVAEESKKDKFDLKSYFKIRIFSICISVIMIPVLLIVGTDEHIKHLFPLNYGTAVLAGWQTQSLFKTALTIASNMIKK